MKEKKVHMIGNAHLDPVWLWQWQEGFQEVKSTFRSALDRMEEYEDFLFTASSAAFYEWVEKSDPGMFQEIKARIAEGRWQIVGRWWIQPDCNIPGGESFVRQALYGQRYFEERARLLRVHAPRAPREGAARRPVLVGVRRRLAGVGLPHPLRLLHHGRRPRETRARPGSRSPSTVGCASTAWATTAEGLPKRT